MDFSHFIISVIFYMLLFRFNSFLILNFIFII